MSPVKNAELFDQVENFDKRADGDKPLTLAYFDVSKGFAMDNERLSSLEVKVEHIQENLSEIKSEISNIRFWLLGTVVSIFLGVGGIAYSIASFQASWFQDSLSKNWEVAQDALKRIDASQSRIERMEIKQELNEEYSYPRPRIPSPKPQSK